jgi:hypothetical protein
LWLYTPSAAAQENSRLKINISFTFKKTQMENVTDPTKGKIELPGDTIALQDLMDGMVASYQEKSKPLQERQWLRYNYAEAAGKYNQLAGKNIMLVNITSVIAASNYHAKKSDTLK